MDKEINDGTFEKGLVSFWELRGSSILSDYKEMCKILRECVQNIGMTCVGEPHIQFYGKPEMGFTIMQCLQQSYIVYDVWPRYDYGNLVVNSCKTYDLEEIDLFLRNLNIRTRLKFYCHYTEEEDDGH